MTRAQVKGLAIQDGKLEAEIRSRLEEVEAGLEKAVRSDSDFVTEAATSLVRAESASGRCSSCSADTSATPPIPG